MVDGGGDDGDDLASHGPAVLHLESFWLPRSRCAVWCGQHNRSNRRDTSWRSEADVCLVAPLAEGGLQGAPQPCCPALRRISPAAPVQPREITGTCRAPAGLFRPHGTEVAQNITTGTHFSSTRLSNVHPDSTATWHFDPTSTLRLGIVLFVRRHICLYIVLYTPNPP